MAYEEEGRRIARELRSQYGRLLEARLGAPIELVFERGAWKVPGNFIFKFGYAGSGPSCFQAFLEASGFDTTLGQVAAARPGDVLKPPEAGASAAVVRVGDGTLEHTTLRAVAAHEEARQEHERGVALLDQGQFRAALEIFRKVKAATKEHPEPMNFLNIAVCHAHLNEFPAALAVLEEAMQRWPENARLRQNYNAIGLDARAAKQPTEERPPAGKVAPSSRPAPPSKVVNPSRNRGRSNRVVVISMAGLGLLLAVAITSTLVFESPPSAPSVALLEDCRSEDFGARLRAAATMAADERVGERFIATTLIDGSANCRWSAALAAAHRGSTVARLLPGLKRAAESDANDSVRAMAQLALNRVGGDPAGEPPALVFLGVVTQPGGINLGVEPENMMLALQKEIEKGDSAAESAEQQ